MIIDAWVRDDDRLETISSALFEIFKQCNSASRSEAVVFNFSRLEFVHPLLIATIEVIAHQLHSNYIDVQFTWPKRMNVDDYLGYIGFPCANRTLSSTSVLRMRKQYANKGYVPITKFETTLEGQKISGSLISTIYSLLYRSLTQPMGFKDLFMYTIGEIVDNISQHSASHFGWMFAQYYPYKEYLDLVILDSGKGVKQSYLDIGVNKFSSDKQAISAAIKGESTKPETGRGMGLQTTIRLLTDLVDGDFVLISGNAKYQNKKVDEFDGSFSGTIVALRIPNIRHAINIYDYLE